MQISVDQTFDAELDNLQQSLTLLIAQSNLDPQVAQDILDKTNAINQHLQNNVQQDLMEIRIASGISSLLTASIAMTRAMNMPEYKTLTTFQQSAYANTIRTLLLGAYRGNLVDPSTYTDPYTESIGFIANNWIISLVLQAALTAAAATTYGQTIITTKTIKAHQLLAQVAAAIIAHSAWGLEKKLFITNLYQNIYQNIFQTQNS